MLDVGLKSNGGFTAIHSMVVIFYAGMNDEKAKMIKKKVLATAEIALKLATETARTSQNKQNVHLVPVHKHCRLQMERNNNAAIDAQEANISTSVTTELHNWPQG